MRVHYEQLGKNVPHSTGKGGHKLGGHTGAGADTVDTSWCVHVWTAWLQIKQKGQHMTPKGACRLKHECTHAWRLNVKNSRRAIHLRVMSINC